MTIINMSNSVCKFSHKYIAMMMNVCRYTIQNTDNLHSQNRYAKVIMKRIFKYIEQSNNADEIRQSLDDLESPMLFKDK